MTPKWTVIVPIKPVVRAKTRLGLPLVERTALADGFAADVLTALADCAFVAEVVVVHDEQQQVPGHTTVRSVADPGTGLNPALLAGIVGLAAERLVVAVVADLPCASAADFDQLLTAGQALLEDPAQAVPAAFLGDVNGIGTTALLARASDFHPLFGHRSAAKHRKWGAVSVQLPLPRLRRDVDSLVDLADARRLGVGPYTTTEIRHLDPPPKR